MARYREDQVPLGFRDWLELPDDVLVARFGGIMGRPHHYRAPKSGAGVCEHIRSFHDQVFHDADPFVPGKTALDTHAFDASSCRRRACHHAGRSGIGR
jgi:hypothetical protein